MSWRGLEKERLSLERSLLAAVQRVTQESMSRRSAKGNHRYERSWQREVVHKPRDTMDNLALNDQGATLLIQGTPLRKSTNSIWEQVQLFNTFGTTDEYKEDGLCDQVDRLFGRNSPSKCANDY